MTMTDPIADMLTRIRNAIHANNADVVVPFSNIKQDIAKILKEEGFIKDYSVVMEENKGFMKVQLKYSTSKKSVITKLRRVSRPGLRRYVPKDRIPKVLNGLGISIISSSQGVVSDRKAREMGVGGELLCTIY